MIILNSVLLLIIIWLFYRIDIILDNASSQRIILNNKLDTIELTLLKQSNILNNLEVMVDLIEDAKT